MNKINNPKQNDPYRFSEYQIIIIAVTIVSGYGLTRYFQKNSFQGGEQPTIFGSIVLLIWVGGLLVISGITLLTFTKWNTSIWRWATHLQQTFQRFGRLNCVIFVLLGIMYAFILLGPLGESYSYSYVRMGIFSLILLPGLFLLHTAGHENRAFVLLATASLLYATIYRFAAYLPEISLYPFSLDWSEASRYYYASTFLADQIYGIDIPPTVLHPSRYLMQAIPYLLPSSPLWVHRAWQVILWITTSSLSGYLITRRISIKDQIVRSMVWAWVILTLLSLPVYYHLQLSLIIILATFSLRRPWHNLFFVIIASALAGISRVNWYPVPALLAITLYVLEKQVAVNKLGRYVIWPFLFGTVGVFAAFLSQWLYIEWSGNPVSQFTSSFTSDLLFYRLFPNPTYRLGILGGAILYSIPFWAIMGIHLVKKWQCYHILRILMLGLITLTLITGGIVVSLKIGGGSNMHNLDSYFEILIVIALYIYFAKFEQDFPTANITGRFHRRYLNYLHTGAIILAIILPITSAIRYGGPLSIPQPEAVEKALRQIARIAEKPVSSGKDILFIGERQLLTFNVLPNVKLIPEYERVYLMEMAMAGNESYLDQFETDLRNQKYALIINEPVFIRYKGSSEPFGEENDAWVSHVAEPILCYYKPLKYLKEVRVQILVPRGSENICAQ